MLESWGKTFSALYWKAKESEFFLSFLQIAAICYQFTEQDNRAFCQITRDQGKLNYEANTA